MLLNAGWASDHGLTLGDEIRPADWVPGEPAFHVIGLVDDVGLGALERGAVLIVDRAQLDSMIAKPAPVVAVDVQTVDGHAADVEAALDRQLREPFVVETAADAATRFARAQAAFAPIAFLFGLVALVVGAFLVANTMAMTVGERCARDRAPPRRRHDQPPGAVAVRPAGAPHRRGGVAARHRAGYRVGGGDDQLPARHPGGAHRRPAAQSGRAPARRRRSAWA